MATKKKAGVKASAPTDKPQLVVRFKYADDSFHDVPFEAAIKIRERQVRALGAIDAEEAAKAASVEHGKKGGRPSKAARDAVWLALFKAAKSKPIPLSAREIYDDIAADAGVKWTAVRDAISEHRKRLK